MRKIFILCCLICFPFLKLFGQNDTVKWVLNNAVGTSTSTNLIPFNQSFGSGITFQSYSGAGVTAKDFNGSISPCSPNSTDFIEFRIAVKCGQRDTIKKISFEHSCSGNACLQLTSKIDAGLETQIGSDVLVSLPPAGTANFNNLSIIISQGDTISLKIYGASNMITLNETITIANFTVFGTTGIVSPIFPNPVITGTSTICNGSSTTFDAGNFNIYQWSTGAITKTISVNSAGTYSVTVTNGNGCTGSDTTVLTVKPRPTGNITSANVTICKGASTNITGTVTAVGTWTLQLSNGGGPVNGTGSGSFSHSVSPTVTTTYTIVSLTDSNNCPSIAADLSGSTTVTVKQRPAGNITSANVTICNGASTNITGTVTAVGSWTLQLSNGGGPVNGNGSGSFSHSVSPTVTTTYTIVSIIDSNNCPSIAADLTGSTTVTVKQRPTGNITSANVTICNGASTNITGTVTAVGSWTLQLSNGGGTVNGNGSGSFSHSVSPTVTTTYTIVSLTDSNNCPSIAADLTGSTTVTVNPLPTAIAGSNDTLCVGEQIQIGFSPAQQNCTYSWTPPNNIVTASISNPVVTANNIFTIPINQDYTLTSTDTITGCQKTATKLILVNPIPPGILNSGDISICEGNNVTIQFITPSNPNIFYAYTNSDTTIVQSPSLDTVPGPSIVFQTNNDSDVTLSATFHITPLYINGGKICPGTDSIFIIYVKPKPTFLNASFLPTICSDFPLNFTLIPEFINGVTYSWDPILNPHISGATTANNVGASTITDVLHNDTNVDTIITYNLTLTFDIGNAPSCSTITSLTVTVNPTPVIFDDSISICSGEPFFIVPENGIPNGFTIVPSAINYTWLLPIAPIEIIGESPGSNDTIGDVLGNTSNTTKAALYHIIPMAGTCKGDTFNIKVNVNPTPKIPDTTITICSGETFVYNPINNNGTIIEPVKTEYSWLDANITDTISGANAGSSIDSIFQTLQNLTNQVQSTTYHIIPTSTDSGLCPGSSFILTVVVNPTPKIPDTTITICSGDIFVFNPVNNNGTIIEPFKTNYSWQGANIPGVISGANAGSSTDSIFQTLQNLTNHVDSTTYQITPTSQDSGLCPGNSFNLTVVVNPTPKIPDTTVTICSGDTFVFNPVNNNGTIIEPFKTNYSWQGANIPGVISGANAGSSTDSIFQTLQNLTNHVDSTTYHITPTSTDLGLCAGNTFDLTVVVNPTPAIPNYFDTICSGTAFNVIPVNGIPNNTTIVPIATSYSWPVPIMSPNINGGNFDNNQNSISQILFNTSSIDTGSATYFVVPISGDSGSCKGNTFQVKINVNPSPLQPVFNSLTFGTIDHVCAGTQNVNFNVSGNLVFPGASYHWYIIGSNGDTIRNSEKIVIKDATNFNTVISFDSTGTFIITVTVTNTTFEPKCDQSFSETIVVDPGGFEQRKIIFKEPGALLIYPDNQVSGYQWGVDPYIKDSTNKIIAGIPYAIAGQVFQVFVPDTNYKHRNDTLTAADDSLKKDKYFYWVIVSKGVCRSKIYYNGPYARGSIEIPEPQPEINTLIIYPNPSNGNIKFELMGKISGNLKCIIYNVLGERVFEYKYMKSEDYSLKSEIDLSWLSNGIYSIEMLNEKNEKASNRLIIYR